MRAAILTGIIVCMTSVAYAHGNDKGEHAAKSNSEAKADAKANAKTENAKPLSPAEAQVINALHVANQTEVAAGKLAVQNGDSAAVKRYGRMLAKDHAAADRKLAAFAARRGFMLSGTASSLTNLETRKGADFDSAFITIMVKDHADAIALVKNAQATCEDKEVHAILDQTLPVLQRHHSEAVKMQQQAYGG